MPGGRLTLVAPNIVATERALAVDPADFRLWVCLHEVTHRTQFAAAPWLHEHVRSLLGEYCRLRPGPGRAARRGCAGRSARSPTASAAARQLSLLEIVQTPEQRAVLDRVTGLMSLLEGHADVVMDGVGPSVVPSVGDDPGRFEAAPAVGQPARPALRRLLGMDMKMRQYAEGACSSGPSSPGRHGRAQPGLVGPEMLPTRRRSATGADRGCARTGSGAAAGRLRVP